MRCGSFAAFPYRGLTPARSRSGPSPTDAQRRHTPPVGPVAPDRSHPGSGLDWLAVDGNDRARTLAAYAAEAAGCTGCPLSVGRTSVVFGAGDPDADLMVVGEAPGFHEDRHGRPMVGDAGELLDGLLAGIGLTRDQVYLATILKCRPPGNRDPLPEEIAACEPHLFRQVELVRPRVVATLGNVATRLLSGRPHGITRVHGQELEVTIGAARVVVYPLYHPAAALYTPSMLSVLATDFARLPDLLAGVDEPSPCSPIPPAASPAASDRSRAAPESVQLGLF